MVAVRVSECGSFCLFASGCTPRKGTSEHSNVADMSTVVGRAAAQGKHLICLPDLVVDQLPSLQLQMLQYAAHQAVDC